MKKSQATNRDPITTARLLSEALPHIQRHDHAIVVIKLGGHAMSSKAAMGQFARDIVMLRQCNLRPVIVHGGGPMINEMLERLEIKTEFKDGMRISTPEVVDVVEMVLSGRVNKIIVQAINAQGAHAVGLSGKDAGLLKCRPTDPALGLVGEPESVNPSVLHSLLESGFIPVIAPLGIGPEGASYNVNGDTASGAIAAGLNAKRLLLLTDVLGVKDDKGEVLTDLRVGHILKMIESGVIRDGMVPKVRTAMAAVENGVEASVILDGRQANACLLELFTDYGAGTMIRA